MGALTDKCEKLTASLQRTVAFALVPVVIGVMWAAIAWPLMRAYESHAVWRNESISALEHAQSAETEIALLAQQLESLPNAPIWRKFYTVNKAGTAGSMLQTDVGALLHGVRATVQSMTPVRGGELNGLPTVGVRIAASMTIDQLKALLVAAATHTRYLRIEWMRINAPSQQLPDHNANLTVTMEIVGIERLQDQSARATPVRESTIAAGDSTELD